METYNGLPLLKISLESDIHGVDKISLVDFPAIEENWLAFSKGKTVDEYLFAHLAEQKLAGPLLIPDIKILREDKEGNRFYVEFPKNVIKQIAERFNKNLNGGKWNIDHNENELVEDVYVSENWIIDDSNFDKSKKFGHNLPVGTWYGIVKVDNSEVWENKIVSGELKGFSVELLSGLQLSIDRTIQNDLYESHVESILDTLGETVGEHWREALSIDISDDEELLDSDNALSLAIQSDPDADSSLDVNDGNRGKWLVRYKYKGPRDSKNRTFCASLLEFQGTNTVFRKEDINQMSFTTSNPEFGTYSIFRYKGSFGCRHKWQRVIFFNDFEDDETRKVGSVPRVTRNINDKEATKVNLKNQNKMANQKFATITELPLEERIVGASVDNENGEFEVEGVKYIVVDGLITEVVSEIVEGEDKPEIDSELLSKFMSDVLSWMAEKDAQIEGLVSKVSGADDTSNEQFSKLTEGVEALSVMLSLIPSTVSASDTVESQAGTIATALAKIKAQGSVGR
tara:strand:+ start:164 stop:1702 length:1539 start_codon:yes stop_codon:yes gene_type:complete